MPSQTSLFSTVLQHLPMASFDHAVKAARADKGVRSLTTARPDEIARDNGVALYIDSQIRRFGNPPRESPLQRLGISGSVLKEMRWNVRLVS